MLHLAICNLLVPDAERFYMTLCSILPSLFASNDRVLLFVVVQLGIFFRKGVVPASASKRCIQPLYFFYSI